MSLSEAIYRQVSSDLHLSFVESGHLGDGVRVWKVDAPTANQAEQSHLSGPGVLLVLPFQRLGSDSDQDYLVDGITEDLISAISEYGEFQVVPRSSAFAYKESELEDRDIARRLDATYILRGSVRTAESRVRVSVELAEAETGEMLWSDRFDRTFEDVLDLQDEIAFAITSKLVPAVRDREVRRSLSRTDSIESWDLMQRGKWHYYQATKEDFDTAVDLYEQAIAADPANPQVYPWLGLVLITRVWHGWSQDVRGDFERTREMASEGIRLNPGDWRSHDALATYYMFLTRDFDRAIAEAEHGEKFEPGVLGTAYQRAGDHERSIELLMRDLRINPNRPDRYHWTTNLSMSHYMLGNYEAALAWADRSLEINPRYIQAVGFRAASLAQLGRLEEARQEMGRFLEHFSGMTAARYETRFILKNHSDIDHYMEGLIKAGMPAGDEESDDERAVWIAVLPFENMSGDPYQEYFADGITEDVITGLSAYRSLRVIARSSSFRYRDSALSIPQIAEELDVQFILEGSVRRAGNRVRVTAQLIEAPDRHHIWADRYDADIEDIFDAQDRITSSIVAAIDPAIRADHVSRPHPDDLKAWDHVQRGWYHIWKAKPEANRTAASHFREAIEIDPDYAEAHAGLGSCLAVRVWLLWSEDPEAELAQAERHAKQAIELDERDAMGHEAMSLTAYAQGRMEATVKEGDRAIHLNPSRAVAYMMAGAGRIHGGHPDAGIPLMTKAMEISPQDPFNTWFLGGRAIGHLLAGHHEDAVADAREAIKTRYGYLMGRVILTVALVQLGQEDEAKAELGILLEIDPDFSTEYLARYTLTEAQREMFVSSLERAGLAG
jgi:adenylate cyclase